MRMTEISTPFKKRRVFEYANDENTVVRHWHDMQHVSGTLYQGKCESDNYGRNASVLYMFLPGIADGLTICRLDNPERYDVKEIMDSVIKSGKDSAENLVAALNKRMDAGFYINNAMISFVRQFNPERAECYEKHRQAFIHRRDVEEETERKAQKKQVDAKRKAEDERKAAELASKKAKYFGFADSMTPMRLGKVDNLMSALIKVDGAVMSRRDFVIRSVKEGWRPSKTEKVIAWNGRRTVLKTENRKTEYQLQKENLTYRVSKTEYDFAKYIEEHKEVLD